ncbi:MAG: 6,7-dimethyl-8-ribityllumazine synthase [Candidatus Eremiobacteraeota bacterium]|nr:6,7-dimethyl-8-ribityllumazine synthase [Candidatus Eremiobacteraeota bacterium]
MRFAIVRSLYNGEITTALQTGAVRAFVDGGVPPSDVEVFEVPGSFELPVCALWLANTKRFDAIVCLGCVIRGETTHFEYVAGEAARGITNVALQTGVPVIFGVLTTATVAQARQRASDVNRGTPQHSMTAERLGVKASPEATKGNKGYEAAQSALHMAALRNKLSQA